MATTTDPKKFVADIRKMATITQRRQVQIVNEGALLTKTIILSEAAQAGVTPASKIAGGKWGVRYNVKGFNNPAALVRIFGPFHLVDRPTKSHEIGPRKKGRRRSGKKAVSFNGIARATVQHPGTKGKGTFPDAKKKASVAVPRIMAKSVVSGWRDALR
jgi:hypothetical protein